MRRLFFLTLTVVSWLSAAAIDRTAAAMQRIADRQLNAMGIAETSALLDETPACAIYGSSAGGFVVVNRNADGRQVLGYSTSVYTPGHMPCGFDWWLNAVSEAQQHGSLKRASSRKYNPVDNFLKTRWGQDAPYNEKCPKLSGKRPPAGCIATAMAQVMRYYEWPAQGQGMGGYYLNNHFVDEAVDGTYSWDKMLNVPYSAGTKKDIRAAVSTLLYDCGKAVKMQYDLDGSGAYQFDQALALARHFQYDSLSLQYCERYLYDTDQWMDLIDGEIQAGRPILYSADDANGSGGHAFVFSGIDADGNVWVNWGWTGSGDGYYAVDLLDVSPYRFANGQEMNIGIKPMASTGPDGVYRSKWAVYLSAAPAVTPDHRHLTIPYYYIYNAHFLPFTGSVGLYIRSTDGQGYGQLKLVKEMATQELAYGEGYTNINDDNTYEPVELSFDELPIGCYQVCWASKAVQETDVQAMLDENSAQLSAPFFMAKNDNGTLSCSDQEITTAVRAVATQTADAASRYYRPDGRPATAAGRGLTIIRQGSTVRKIVR